MSKDTKDKIIWNAIPRLFDVPNPPSKVTSSCPIKIRLVTVPAKVVEKPVDVLPDLPSASPQKQSKYDTPQKKKLLRLFGDIL